MNVVDRRHHRTRVVQISVVTRTFLPKSKRFDTRTLTDCQLLEKISISLLKSRLIRNETGRLIAFSSKSIVEASIPG
jgi:hypothetical protein